MHCQPADWLNQAAWRTDVFPLGLLASTISKQISAYGEAVGIEVSDRKHASAHDLRRMFGQRWALRVHLIVLKTIMRHSAIETTLRYYFHPETTKIAESVWASVTPNVTNLGYNDPAARF